MATALSFVQLFSLKTNRNRIADLWLYAIVNKYKVNSLVYFGGSIVVMVEIQS